jgi:hypothetical protein
MAARLFRNKILDVADSYMKDSATVIGRYLKYFYSNLINFFKLLNAKLSFKKNRHFNIKLISKCCIKICNDRCNLVI